MTSTEWKHKVACGVWQVAREIKKVPLFFALVTLPSTPNPLHFLITDHPTSLFELRRASWLPTYAEAPAGKLITDHWSLITTHWPLITFFYFVPRHFSLITHILLSL